MSWRIARLLIWESVATNLMRVALALLQNLLSGFEVLFAQQDSLFDFALSDAFEFQSRQFMQPTWFDNCCLCRFMINQAEITRTSLFIRGMKTLVAMMSSYQF